MPDDARGEDKKSKKANLKRAGTVDPQDQWEKQKAIQRAGTSDPQEQWRKEIAIRPSTNTKCREEKEVRGKKTEDMEARRMSSARATHEDIGGLLNAGKSTRGATAGPRGSSWGGVGRNFHGGYSIIWSWVIHSAGIRQMDEDALSHDCCSPIPVE